MSPRRFAMPLIAAVVILIAVILLLPGIAGGPGGPNATPSGTLGSGAASAPASTNLREVRLLLGFQPDVQFAPFYLAKQAGYFADAGLEVSIEYSDDVIRLVADGQSEFGVADATDVMVGRTAGIPIKYVATLYDHFPVALIGAPEVVPAEPSGLAGLRIGTPGRFGSSWHALLALLDAGGLTADDVTIREYPQFNQVEGLLNGDVDLITGFRANEPLRLEAQGFDVKLLTVDDFAPLPGPGIVVGDELLSADRTVVKAFAAAIVRAQQAIADDPDLGLQAAVIEVPTIGEDEATARAVLEATVGAWDPPIDGVIPTDVWARGFATMERLGFIDGTVPVEEMYDLGVMGEPG
ncbi:MAG: ABC transporter substrate-binding protein [Chloroflexota bacterium]